ncbi:hypothetical protein BKA70DRAFT_1330050, partial [Coprinopsis sp. MPI-PUGE-AT-0042]
MYLERKSSTHEPEEREAEETTPTKNMAVITPRNSRQHALHCSCHEGFARQEREKSPHLQLHPCNVPLHRPIDGVKSSTIPLLSQRIEYQLRQRCRRLHLRCIAASKEPQAPRTAHGCSCVGMQMERTPPGVAPASQPHNQATQTALLPLQLSLPHPVPSAHLRHGFRPTGKRQTTIQTSRASNAPPT